MSIEEEKRIAKEFFKTSIGKEVLKKIAKNKQMEAEILELNKELNKTKCMEVNKKIEDEEMKAMINNAISLYHQKKAPQFLFSLADGVEEVKRCYTTDIDDLLKSMVNEERC